MFIEWKGNRRDRAVNLRDVGAITAVPVCRHGQRNQLPHGHLQQAAAG